MKLTICLSVMEYARFTFYSKDKVWITSNSGIEVTDIKTGEMIFFPYDHVLYYAISPDDNRSTILG